MLAVILTLCGATATWAQDVSYIERTWNETNKEVVSTTKTLVSGTYNAVNGNEPEGWPELTTGWWVVTANSTYKTLAITGDVHLIIPDDVTLTLTGGVKLESDAQTSNKLTIYGQNYNSGTLTVTNSYSGAAGIGGGEGKSCGTLEIHGGTINATGGDKGAGIGGGSGQGFYGQFTIYGGSVTATGGDYGAGIGSGDENPSNMAGYITIYGGTITATGGLYAAGIGGGDKGDGASLKVYGGTINATANKNAAGIGGGRYGNGVEAYIYDGTVESDGTLGGGDGDGHSGKGNGGRIEISGGTVKAIGREEAHPGAGIGCGNKGESATIIISGGTVTAASGTKGTNAAGIGGGGHYQATLDITISGGTVITKGDHGIGSGTHSSQGEIDYKGTLSISGGEVYATGWIRAIGGENVGNVMTLYDEAQVTAGDNAESADLFSAAERVPACIYRKYTAIKPCAHNDATYTVTEETHQIHCAYCLTSSDPEAHKYSGGKCSVCGYESNICTVTIYLPDEDTQTDGDYGLPITYNMVTNETFNLPPAPNTPDEMEFAGWVIGNVSRASFITDGSETLLEAEREYTITSDIILTARYRYLDVSLVDDASNTETLVKHNGKTAHSVTLSGRTLYKDGSWNTLCLPFDMTDFTGTPLDGATVKTLTGASYNSETQTLTLNFSDNLTAIVAGMPYIVKWGSTESTEAMENTDIFSPVFNNVTVSNIHSDVAIDDAVTFKSILSPYAISGEDKTLLYLGAGNKLYYPNAAMTIGACRAYFQLADGLIAGEPATSTDNGINQFVLNFGDGETSGIVDVDFKSTSRESGISNPLKQTWFTLDGRKLSGKPTQKGIYIKNGRKVVIK